METNKKPVIPHRNPNCKCFRCSGVAWNKGIKTGKNPEHSRRMKRRIPWNKGLEGFMAAEKHWTYGKKRPEISGNNNSNWKGDAVGYDALHRWVYRHKGRPESCELCNSNKKLEWANISQQYKRKLDDFMSLCRFCHIKYDSGKITI